MTDNTRIDLAKRVAEALSRTEVSCMPHPAEFNPDMHVPLGEVPVHLRGLGTLVGEMLSELIAAERSARAAEENFKTVHGLFRKALQSHLPASDEKPPIVDFTLYGDWKIAGIKRRSTEEMVDEVLQGMGFRRE